VLTGFSYYFDLLLFYLGGGGQGPPLQLPLLREDLRQLPLVLRVHLVHLSDQVGPVRGGRPRRDGGPVLPSVVFLASCCHRFYRGSPFGVQLPHLLATVCLLGRVGLSIRSFRRFVFFSVIGL
jgi:hypothetical protein